MLTLNCFSQTRWDRPWRIAQILAFLLVVPQLSAGSELSIRPQTSPQSVAFGRYLESLGHGSPFAGSGPIAVLIQASIPALYKESALRAVRQVGDNERSEFQILGMGGDGAVLQEVIARYFALQEQMENLPRSSILITPENYGFQFRGQVSTGSGSAYVYDITPKKRRPGLCKGQIWIDAVTGTELLVSGQLADTFPTSVAFVRETNLDASGYTRVTHLTFAVPLLGRSEVMVTESPRGRNIGSSCATRATAQLPRRSRAEVASLLKLASDIELAHARLQRRALHAEPGGCAIRSANLSVRFFQRLQDARTFASAGEV